MPDDIKVVAGVGDSTVAPPVATDDIGGRHFPRLKAGWGAEGVFQETTDTDGLRIPIGGAQIGALNETAATSDTAPAGLNGRLQRVAQRLSSLITIAGQQATETTLDAILSVLPITRGQQTAANSLGVTASTEDTTRIGVITETAPAFDTASSGLNGRLQRVAQRLTSIYNTVQVMLMDATFIDLTGLTDETAPASDTAAARLNGRLQRVAQNVTTLIGRFPTTLGQKTAANSLAVTLASDQPSVAISSAVHVPASAIDGSVSTAGNNQQVMTGQAGLRLLGFTVHETTGVSPALVYVRQGVNTSALPLAIVSLAPGESVREWYGPDGLVATAGIFFQRSVGTTQFSTFYKVVP
jgi:hypothetical protein